MPLCALLQWVLLLLLFLFLPLYHGVLLIQQLPDLVVVVTQAAFQADASGLRLDRDAQVIRVHLFEQRRLISAVQPAADLSNKHAFLVFHFE